MSFTRNYGDYKSMNYKNPPVLLEGQTWRIYWKKVLEWLRMTFCCASVKLDNEFVSSDNLSKQLPPALNTPTLIVKHRIKGYLCFSVRLRIRLKKSIFEKKLLPVSCPVHDSPTDLLRYVSRILVSVKAFRSTSCVKI